jgi:hypothetical protein
MLSGHLAAEAVQHNQEQVLDPLREVQPLRPERPEQLRQLCARRPGLNRFQPLAALPGSQSLSRGLPGDLGAEEGFGAAAAARISSLPRRKNSRSVAAADENESSFFKVA